MIFAGCRRTLFGGLCQVDRQPSSLLLTALMNLRGFPVREVVIDFHMRIKRMRIKRISRHSYCGRLSSQPIIRAD